MTTFAANPIYSIMYSSEDLERFYFQYQSEALPHGESLQSFCVKNKVPYNIFQKWFKDTRKKVVEVQVDGAYCKKTIITSFILQYLCHSRNKTVTLH